MGCQDEARSASRAYDALSHYSGQRDTEVQVLAGALEKENKGAYLVAMGEAARQNLIIANEILEQSRNTIYHYQDLLQGLQADLQAVLDDQEGNGTVAAEARNAKVFRTAIEAAIETIKGT